MHLQHPKAIQEVQVVQPSSQRRQLFLVVLVALYAIVGSWVYSTVGDPYALAVLEAERLDNEKELSTHVTALEDGGITAVSFDAFDDEDEEEHDVVKRALLEKENRGKTHSKRNKPENETKAQFVGI